MSNLYGWVVGGGHMGSLHLKKLLKHKDVDVEVYDPPKGLTPSRSNPDFAIVATPAHSHKVAAQPFLAYGIPVLIEKPIATTREDAAWLAKHPNCFVAHIERFNPTWKILDGGCQPKFIQAERMGQFSNRSIDIGVALDLMIHDIDLCLSLTNGPIQDIRAIAMGLHTKQDLINARIETSECVFQLTASRISRQVTRQVRLFSSSEYWSLNLQSQSAKMAKWTVKTVEEQEIPIPPEDALENQINGFMDHVRQIREFPIRGEAGFRAVDLALRITEAC
ncbi:MAG: Gfo/Idh/MocA family protein [Myxococcota bacterium]